MRGFGERFVGEGLVDLDRLTGVDELVHVGRHKGVSEGGSLGWLRGECSVRLRDDSYGGDPGGRTRNTDVAGDQSGAEGVVAGR